MQLSFPNGTWPLKIEDVDIHNLSDDDIQKIGDAITRYGLVIFKGQQFTPDEEVEFCKRFGTLGTYENEPKELHEMAHRENIYIKSVTAAKDSKGRPGFHPGKGDLDWHCGRPWYSGRCDSVFLYSVKGSKGSRTSFLNGAEAYKDLSDEWKQKIANFKLRINTDFSRYSELGIGYSINHVETSYHPDMVVTLKTGEKSIFYPFFQCVGIFEFPGTPEEESEILEFLKNHLTQDKYIYHHDWDNGDITMHDNWNGLHKRWAFEQMEERLLHRIEVNFSNIEFGLQVFR